MQSSSPPLELLKRLELLTRLRHPGSLLCPKKRGNLAHVRSLAATHNEMGMRCA
jgi:hypothetical protein